MPSPTSIISYRIDIGTEWRKSRDNFDTTIVSRPIPGSRSGTGGVKSRQTDKDLVLRDADDHEISHYPFGDRPPAVRSRTSLMPAVALADSLTRPELIDLDSRFLSELGKVVDRIRSAKPRSPAAGKLAVLQTHSTLASAVADDPSLQWTPAYSRVSGDLPLADLTRITGDDQRTDQHRPLPPGIRRRWPRKVQTEYQRRPNPLDRPKTDRVRPDFTLDLAAGQHTIVVEIHLAQRKTRSAWNSPTFQPPPPEQHSSAASDLDRRFPTRACKPPGRENVVASYVTSLIFALTYLGLVFGKVLRASWNGIVPALALVGAILMLITGMLSINQAVATDSIDYRTLALLFGMMIVVGFLRLSGFFQRLTTATLRHISTPVRLLAVTVALSGVLSAFLINDIVCLALTPLVLHLARRLRFDPLPHVIALATAANIGSTGTITGNPQNIFIGSHSGISYLRFAERLLPVAIVGLLLDFLVILIVHRRRLLL